LQFFPIDFAYDLAFGLIGIITIIVKWMLRQNNNSAFGLAYTSPGAGKPKQPIYDTNLERYTTVLGSAQNIHSSKEKLTSIKIPKLATSGC